MSSRRLLNITSIIFFISGFCALLYQVVWQRMLGLFTGSDVQSVTVITAAYLGGLGVGSLIGSHYADRLNSRQAVQTYALCNLGIAVFALFSRFLYYDLLFKQLTVLAISPLVMLITVFVSLLWPTVLMGLSLPLLAKALVHSVSGAAPLISRLYGLNTLGAGLGAFICGWFLIGILGYGNSVIIGSALSLLVAYVAWSISRQFDKGEQAVPTSNEDVLTRRNVPRSVWVWCFLVFVSGFIVISLEIVWFRILDFIVKSSAYTFGHLLAIFLIGDALGSLMGARVVKRIINPRRFFLWIQGLIALYSVGVTWLLAIGASHNASLIAQYIISADSRIRFSYLSNPSYLLGLTFVYLLVPIIILLPPAFMIGFYYPVIQKAIQTDTRVVGQRVGLVDVANIAGNTLGSILTGTLLLNVLGTANSLRLISLLGLIFVVLLIMENLKRFRLLPKLTSGLISAVLVGYLLFFPQNNEFWSMMHSNTATEGYFIVAEDSSGISAVHEDGKTGNVWINGRHQGVIPYYPFHSFLGVLPALVHPQPSDALTIGLGTGGSPYGLGVNSNLDNIQIVEIVGSNVDILKRYSARDFGRSLQKIFNDPRYRINIGDGRRELVVNDAMYDVIVIDALLPWTSHAGLLYSSEFYDVVKARLKNGGIVVQWRPTDRSERGFFKAFPYGILIGDVVLVGSLNPIGYAPDTLMKRLSEPEIAQYLEPVGTSAEVLRYWIVDVNPVFWSPNTIFDSTDINTDLLPRDEYYLNNHIGDIHLPNTGGPWINVP